MEEDMKEPWREEPPKLRIHITQTPGDYLTQNMWVRLQEAYGENSSWNAEKQTNKTYKLTPHKPNKQKKLS